ncbi:PREDICTED: facilitated trehalose transporter Tret1-like [Eufriesea mexicana]|uniref:facilitated trehalose transporter Tret1-like n=1 Tax=Eufriesea mexicana TaxID=516756 RepID=UPI00083BBD17|nr:PREDICTED: facilitated trehalose transporter Tret1-like [Eufriesea mexicana]XP_017757196.1 PREDICTED: facilitated trehalose transporter Tret1-like [Eufriesea mexicana]
MTDRNKTDEPGMLRQLFVTLIVNISALSFGTMVGWQSPTIPQLQSENPPVGSEPMTDEAASWLTGITCISATIMSLTVGMIADRFGRKVTGCLMALPFCLSWLFTIFATEHMHLYIARFFAGISGGMVLFLIPLYISEITSDGIRGMLGSLVIFLLNSGILFGYILGALLSYRLFSISMLMLPLLYFALFVFMPETPVYLVRRNRINEAIRALTWLRNGHKSTVEREMLRLQEETKEFTVSERSTKLLELFRDRATIKGLLITLGLFGGQQFSGIFAMLSYTETIFKMSGSSLSPNSSVIIVGVIQVFGSCLSTSLMEKAGRRPLLLISCLGMGLCHFTLGTFCYLQSLQYDVSRFSWISIVALSVFMITYGLGLGPGPYVICSEILSRNMASLVLMIGISFAWGMAFLVVKLFPNVVDVLGVHGCFFLLGTSCAITFVFIFVLIPETKGLPRQVILDRLNGIPHALNKKEYVSSDDIVGKNTPLPALI